MREFRLPDVGEGISEGELLEWRVVEGDTVEEGDILAEVVTDKITFELPSPAAGVVTSLRAAAGDIVTVGEVILVLDGATGETGTDGAEHGGTKPSSTTEFPARTELSATTAPPPGPTTTPTPQTPADDGAPADPLAAALGRVIAAPSTRRLAADLGVDLTRVAGQGPGGRILRADVAAARATTEDQGGPVRSDAAGSPAIDDRASRLVPIRGVRRTTFEHMLTSSQTTATVTTTFEVPGDGILQLIEELRPEAEAKDVRITPVVIIAACLGQALGRHERLNATIEQDGAAVRMGGPVNLGVAVAAPSGLLVPVVQDIGGRRLTDVARDLTAVSARARDGRVTQADMTGGTFTLSSTGGLEQTTILSTTPVLNLPQVACLWVSRIVPRPRVVDGALDVGPMLVASLSFDHRVVDGVEATAFINDLADLMAAPTRGLM